jgi:hypothetical protein
MNVEVLQNLEGRRKQRDERGLRGEWRVAASVG